MVERIRTRLRGWAKGGRLPEGPWPEGATAWGDYIVAYYRAPSTTCVGTCVCGRTIRIAQERP
jgi:hypothetical protein